MKKVEITKFSHAEVDAPSESFGFMRIPVYHKLIRAEGGDLQVSDGYHTMDELYDHRITLYIALCKQMAPTNEHLPSYGFIWRSKKHSDGEVCFGTGTQFALGIGKIPGKQITYHIPIERWDETNFAKTLEKAPEWDGHTSDDVLKRLKILYN